jgi:hypothetical protein
MLKERLNSGFAHEINEKMHSTEVEEAYHAINGEDEKSNVNSNMQFYSSS